MLSGFHLSPQAKEPLTMTKSTSKISARLLSTAIEIKTRENHSSNAIEINDTENHEKIDYQNHQPPEITESIENQNCAK